MLCSTSGIKLVEEMTQVNSDDGLFVIVELNYEGMYTRNPFSYFGGGAEKLF